ncbi:MAG: NAD(P)H-dependent oxidoreductase subunit E, partial [Planctomycetaceae bacterium]
MPVNIPNARADNADISKIVSARGNHAAELLPILQDANAAGLPIDVRTVSAVANEMRLPANRVEGAASFYKLLDREVPTKTRVRLCSGVACWLAGGDQVIKECEAGFAGDDETCVSRSSCLGLCDHALAAVVNDTQVGPVTGIESCSAGSHRDNGSRQSTVLEGDEPQVLLAHSGIVDPKSFDAAVQTGVYDGLQTAIRLQPSDVIERINSSGLSGRGGAGFPTGRKWNTVADAAGDTKYVICNADESEPLMFKDRVLMETNPHAVVAGIAIAAHAINATKAFIYIRGEYEPQARLLERAIREFAQSDLCTDRWPKGLSIHVHRGAGAYVCGEETALIESLEGKRGEPRLRPPYPAESGYLDRPTLVNNVETLVHVSRILASESDCQANTRLVTLLGHLGNTGLAEVTFGKTLRELLDLAGGMRSGSNLQCILVGGASGVIVGPDALDKPLDY